MVGYVSMGEREVWNSTSPSCYEYAGTCLSYPLFHLDIIVVGMTIRSLDVCCVIFLESILDYILVL